MSTEASADHRDVVACRFVNVINVTVVGQLDDSKQIGLHLGRGRTLGGTWPWTRVIARGRRERLYAAAARVRLLGY